MVGWGWRDGARASKTKVSGCALSCVLLLFRPPSLFYVASLLLSRS